MKEKKQMGTEVAGDRETLEKAEQPGGAPTAAGSAKREPSGKQKITIDATASPEYYLG